MLSGIRTAVMRIEREVHRLEIYLGDRIHRLVDRLDVRMRMKGVSSLIPKFLVRLTKWMETPFSGGRVEFREKNKSSFGTY